MTLAFSLSRADLYPQNLNGSRHLTTPLSGTVCRQRATTVKINLSAEFDVFICTHYKYMNEVFGVTENSATRYSTYEFLLAFHRRHNYAPILHRF